MKRIDITGQKFGKWTAIKFISWKNHGSSWLFKCDCGTIKAVQAQDVRRGHSKSCGCLWKGKPKFFTHKMRKTRFYNIFAGLKDRCTNLNSEEFKNYGGRGIKCLWQSFESFRDDMYESYQVHIKEFGEKQTTIDRISRDGDYCKKNCRWATRIEQARNTRRNHYIEYRGETNCISKWAEILNIPQKLISRRLRRGWSIEKALTNF